MENFSPDVDAYYCYAVIVVIGLFVAYRQVTALLDIRGIWFVWRTWLLFFAYVLVPALLFWVLDRTAALHDTSLLAAVIVALTYERILSGQSQTYQAVGEVSSLWTPFVAYANDVAQSVRERIFRREQRFRRKLLDGVAANPDQLTALKDLAFAHAQDSAALQQSLDAMDAQAATLGANAVAERRAKLLHKSLAGTDDLDRLMYERKVIDAPTYYLDVKAWDRRALTIALVGAIALGVLWLVLALNRPATLVDYYVWRLKKADTTEIDRFRAKERLADFLGDETVSATAFGALTTALRWPALDATRVDDILEVLLSQRCQSLNAAERYRLPVALTEALRTETADSRDRVNRALVYLANEHGGLGTELANWNPGDEDELELRIDAWLDFWRQHDGLVGTRSCGAPIGTASITPIGAGAAGVSLRMSTA